MWIGISDSGHELLLVNLPTHRFKLNALAAVTPIFLSYVLGFVYVAIYWNNHHHFFHLVQHVDGGMGENNFASAPTAIYGVALLMPALAFHGVQLAILRTHGRDSALAQAIGRDFKGKVSPVLYLAGILSAFVDTRIAGAIYLLVALMWLIPDRRIERVVRRP